MKHPPKKPESQSVDYLPGFLPGLELVTPFIQHTPPDKSNTIELYDALAIYSIDRVNGSGDITAEKVFRGRTYGVRVKPAAVLREGDNVVMLPGRRENLVEKALRKMASDDQSISVSQNDDSGNAEVWVKFTLYELRRTLAEQGHEYKGSELTEALEVLRGARLIITGVTGEFTDGADTNFLQSLVWRRKTSDDPDGREYKIAVKLHPLITKSIIQRTFRQIDFAKLMKPKNELSRWLYTRLSHNYIQGSNEDLAKYLLGDKSAGYHISLTTIIRETGAKYANLRYARDAVRNALVVLKNQDVLRGRDIAGLDFPGWLEEVQHGESVGKNGGRPPVKDIIFYLFPSAAVVDDLFRAHSTAKIIRPR